MDKNSLIHNHEKNILKLDVPNPENNHLKIRVESNPVFSSSYFIVNNILNLNRCKLLNQSSFILNENNSNATLNKKSILINIIKTIPKQGRENNLKHKFTLNTFNSLPFGSDFINKSNSIINLGEKIHQDSLIKKISRVFKGNDSFQCLSNNFEKSILDVKQHQIDNYKDNIDKKIVKLKKKNTKAKKKLDQITVKVFFFNFFMFIYKILDRTSL